MFRRYSRIIAAVVVCFFTWTCGGIFSVANAAAINAKKAKVARPAEAKGKSPEEKLRDATEQITETLSDTGIDINRKKASLRAARGAIEAADPAIRKEFAATEKRLKDAKLPDEILQRHYKFVKNYEDNLKELKGNMERLDKARDKTEAAADMDKIRRHLKRVKAPSRHQALDPNNLPFRQPNYKKREPRMKKEQFQRDFAGDKTAFGNRKRIMVASMGSLAGLLSSSSLSAPTAADLAETVDVQLTPEIKAKALELGNNPVNIYNWVRNNIEYVPTWGSIQGANMTLLTRQGNAFDTSSLLIALLRASGIPAHYVMGTIELPIDKVMNWTGGFTDPMAALDFMNSGGTPATALTEGGKVIRARMEHVWVEALVNYIPSRGAKHVQGKGDTWVKLDPSYKQYTYTQGIDIKSAVPFDAQSFLTQIQSTSTINEEQGYATGIDSAFVQQSMQDYQTRVQNYIQQNYPNATVGDVLGKKEIIKKDFPYLLGTLPYRTAVVGGTFSEIPDSLRHKLTFTVTRDAYDDVPINITMSLPELAGKKITLSYSPATAQDEAVINSYLPKPHADGTPIQPSELPSSLPAYLINVKPELRIDGQVVATGAAIGLGSSEDFDMNFYDPSGGSSLVSNTVDAGAYEAIGLNLGKISREQLERLKAKLEATKTKLEAQDLSDLNKDDLVGDILHTTALIYHGELSAVNYISAKTMGVNAIILPSEIIFTTQLKVLRLWGIPRNVSVGGLNMDADYLINVVKALDKDSEKSKRYMHNIGTVSSVLENFVPEQLFSTPENPLKGISAVKALTIANNQGIPVFTVNQTNISTILPQLNIEDQAKVDIKNAVNAGKEVTVSKTNITYNGWTGCGYIIINPETGAGAYMISGGLNGGTVSFGSIFIGALFLVLGLFFLGPLAPLGVLLLIIGLHLFLLGLVIYTIDFTTEDWHNFCCLFKTVAIYLLGFISIEDFKLIEIVWQMVKLQLKGMSLIQFIDKTFDLGALPCDK